MASTCLCFIQTVCRCIPTYYLLLRRYREDAGQNKPWWKGAQKRTATTAFGPGAKSSEAPAAKKTNVGSRARKRLARRKDAAVSEDGAAGAASPSKQSKAGAASSTAPAETADGVNKSQLRRQRKKEKQALKQQPQKA